MNRVVIETGKLIDKLVFLRNGIIERIDFANKQDKIQEGQIYKGKVQSMIKGMNSALVDLGQGKVGYLQERQLTKHLKNGQEIMVQVKREPLQGKHPKLTREIRLIGRTMILLPRSNEIKQSRKLKVAIDINQIVNEEVALNRGDKPGFILRSSCQAGEESIIRLEYDRLVNQWQKIEKDFAAAYGPQPIFGYDHWEKFILDCAVAEIEEVKSNDEQLLKQIKKHFKEILPVKNITIVHTKYVLDYCGLSGAFQNLFEKKVAVDEQISLVIENTEAFTVIDVNSGISFDHIDFQQNVLEINKKAAKEIYRQIVLRDLSGVILIDFIDMKSEQKRKELVQYMKDIMMEDQKQSKVLSLTELCILQILRKKERDSIMSRATVPCPCCQGTGRVLSDILADVH